MNPVILHYRNVLEDGEVTVTSENPLFPTYRLYDRDIGKLFKGDSAPANFYIKVEPYDGLELDRLIIPAGHNLSGLLLKLQYSTDDFAGDINDAVSWTQPDSGLINKPFTPQNKAYWRLNIAAPVSPPELAEMFLTKDYVFTRKTSYGSTEGHRRNISREESLSGRAKIIKFGEPRRSLKYDLKYFSNAQKDELENWESTCEGVKPIYVTDHNGDLFFMEILNELHFVVVSLNKWSCSLDLLEFL